MSRFATPLRDADGNITGGVEYVIDITDEIRMMDELKRLMKNATEGILDARGDVSAFSGRYREMIERCDD